MHDTAFRYMAASNTTIHPMQIWQPTPSSPGTSCMKARLVGLWCFVLTMLPQKSLALFLVVVSLGTSATNQIAEDTTPAPSALKYPHVTPPPKIKPTFHTCRIIPAGRIFLRLLIDLSTSARLPHHHVIMNHEARRDIALWLRFLPSWNGWAIIPDPYWTKLPDLELFTDASGSLGYDIFYMGHWLANPWPHELRD